MSDLVQRTEAEMSQFLASLFAAIIEMDKLDATLTEDQQEMAARVKENLINLNGNAKFFIALLTEMGQAMRALLRQRQSSKEAFLAGWQGFYRDLAAHLTADQRAELLPIMDGILGEDDECPF
jgi:hypothetical protein